MFEFPKLKILFFVVALTAFGVSRSSASPAPIQDNAAFFSESAKSEAARNIIDLEKAVKKGVVVQTFKEVPSDVRQGVNMEDKAAVNQAISQWALKQFKQNGVNGVYILLVKAPAHLQVEVGIDTQKRAFTPRDRDTLVSTMLAKLHAKQYDDALLDGVNFVSSTMRANAIGIGRTGSTGFITTPRPRQSSSGWVIPLLIGVGVLWLIMSIFRAIFRGGGGVGPGMGMSSMGGGMGGGGGGFFSSLLGGVFGAAAGNWLYDQFSGNRGSSAWGADRDNRDNQANVDQGYSGTDTDASGSGGSFGDDSGGGDSGGSGDAGGGGDSGGGGGDF